MPKSSSVSDGQPFERVFNGATLVAAGLCVAVAIVLLTFPLLRATYLVEVNTNEGWQAMHMSRAMAGLNIYADDDAFVFNNYPPLSFYLVGGLAQVFGDELFIFTGRAISIAALLGTAFGVAWVVRHLVDSRSLMVLSAAYVICLLIYFSESYVAMNDPQMLGHAVMTIALALFVGGRNRMPVLITVALLVCVAGFIKHNLVAVPIAITLYLLIYDRRGLWIWLGVGAVALAISLSITYAAFGPDFFESIFARRPLDPENVMRIGAKLLNLMVPTLVVWIVARYRKGLSRDDVLIGIYMVVAVLVGSVFAAGAAVNRNVFFEVLIANSIALALAIDGLRGLLIVGPRSLGARRAIAVIMVLFALAPMMYIAGRRIPAIPAKIDELSVKAETLADDVAFLRQHPGRWVCQRMFACVVAGTPSEIDFLNGGWALRFGRRDGRHLIENLQNQVYAVVQVTHGRPIGNILTPTPAFTEALLANYELARQYSNVNFYVPKSSRERPG
jgi:hypothetical protein